MSEETKKLLGVTGGTAAGVALITQPAMAQTTAADATAEVDAIMVALGGLAAAAIGIAVAPMAFNFGMKIIRRVMA